jgi:hypothetical protein
MALIKQRFEFYPDPSSILAALESNNYDETEICLGIIRHYSGERVLRLEANNAAYHFCNGHPGLVWHWQRELRQVAGFEVKKYGKFSYFNLLTAWWYYQQAVSNRNSYDLLTYRDRLIAAFTYGNVQSAQAWVDSYREMPASDYDLGLAREMAEVVDEWFPCLGTPGYLLAAELYQELAKKLMANGATAIEVENFHIQALRNFQLARLVMEISVEAIHNAGYTHDTRAIQQHIVASEQLLLRSADLSPAIIRNETLNNEDKARELIAAYYERQAAQEVEVTYYEDGGYGSNSFKLAKCS